MKEAAINGFFIMLALVLAYVVVKAIDNAWEKANPTPQIGSSAANPLYTKAA